MVAFRLLKTAIEQNKLVTFDYYNESGNSFRKVEPYLLIFQWGTWYLWGYCTTRKNFRLFKLNRMISLKRLEVSFHPRKLKSVETHIQQYFTNQIHIIAKFDSCVKWRLIEEYGIDSYKELENKQLLFEFNFSNHEYLMRWIMSFGRYVEVLEPKDIRDEYLNHINDMYQKFIEHDR